MSSSYLFVINKKFKGKALREYADSWLYSPVVWTILEDKYLKPNKDGSKPCVLLPFGVRNAWAEINTEMNSSENTEERVCWELSNQNVFYTKDKDVVADSITSFIGNHKDYGQSSIETGEKSDPLRAGHIIARFSKIATDIKNLNENKYPYFVLKNTSCDDGVEYWFAYDKKLRRQRTLKDWDELPAEFVRIENMKISGFVRIKKGVFDEEE